MFLERLDAPILGTEYYKPNGTATDMPNCTKYCHDRSQESCQNPSLKMFKDSGASGFPEADNWLDKTILPTGNDPKAGSVAVFSNNGGSKHVAFVERVNDDGTVLITDSRYDDDKSLRNDRFWRMVDNVVLKVGKIPTISGVGELLGFMYLPIKDLRVNRDSTISQLEIVKHGVRCRENYGKNSAIVNEGCYVPLGIYDVLETREADGYIWCRVDDSSWIAHDDSWSNLYLVDTDDFDKELTRFVNMMKNEHSNYVAIKQGLSDIQVILERLMKL